MIKSRSPVSGLTNFEKDSVEPGNEARDWVNGNTENGSANRF